jgi:hypothetical protein
MRTVSLSRRRALQSLGGVVATFPFLRDLWAQEASGPRRLLVFMQNNGVKQGAFWPDASFMSPILKPILQHPNLASKTNVVKGMWMNRSDSNGTGANQHDMGFARMLTGAKLMGVGGKPWAGGPSVDQIIAKEWGIDSLTLAVVASRSESRGPKPGYNHRKSFSYVAPGTHKVPLLNPFEAYGNIFRGGGAGGAGPPVSDEAAAQRLRLRKSVLDGVTGNMRELSARLGARERAKLDLHLTSIRQLEARLSSTMTRPATVAPGAPPKDFSQTPALLMSDEAAVPELMTNMMDLAAAGLTTGSTRVASVQWGYGGGKWNLAWLGINAGNHHDNIAHRDGSDPVATNATNDYVIKYCTWYAEHVARVALALDAIPEGEGTMLDNTLIVWANELGRGDHSLENVPVVFIGKAGGALKQGRRLIDNGRQVFNRLGCTVLNLMGKQAAGFGDVPDCGMFQGLV